MGEPTKACGETMRKLRDEKGWSQEQLATAAGLSLRTVQRAETAGSASRETLVCLASALNVDLSTIKQQTNVGAADSDTPDLGFLTSKSFVAICLVVIWAGNFAALYYTQHRGIVGIVTPLLIAFLLSRELIRRAEWTDA